MSKLEKQIVQTTKPKGNLYVFIIQDEDGHNVKVLHDANYEQLWLKGCAEARAMRGYWTIFNLNGEFVDGNFKSKTK